MSPLISRTTGSISASIGSFKSRFSQVKGKLPLLITGGTKYTYNGKIIHVFTTTGSSTLTLSNLSGSIEIEYFIVGGGGNGSNYAGGGGGVVTTGTLTTSSSSISVVVGSQGNQSSFGNITAAAGGSALSSGSNIGVIVGTSGSGGASDIRTGGSTGFWRDCTYMSRIGCLQWYPQPSFQEPYYAGGGGAGAANNGSNGSSGGIGSGGNGVQAPATFRDPNNVYGADNFYFGGGGAGKGTFGNGYAGLGGGGSADGNGVTNTGGGGGGGSGTGASGIVMIAYDASLA